MSVLSAMTHACTVAPDPLRAMRVQVATTKKPVGYVPRAFDFNHGLVWEDLTPADSGCATIRAERSSSAQSALLERQRMRGIILWLLGVPLVVIILLYVFNIL
jgi:hypothetical protein